MGEKAEENQLKRKVNKGVKQISEAQKLTCWQYAI